MGQGEGRSEAEVRAAEELPEDDGANRCQGQVEGQRQRGVNLSVAGVCVQGGHPGGDPVGDEQAGGEKGGEERGEESRGKAPLPPHQRAQQKPGQKEKKQLRLDRGDGQQDSRRDGTLPFQAPAAEGDEGNDKEADVLLPQSPQERPTGQHGEEAEQGFTAGEGEAEEADPEQHRGHGGEEENGDGKNAGGFPGQQGQRRKEDCRVSGIDKSQRIEVAILACSQNATEISLLDAPGFLVRVRISAVEDGRDFAPDRQQVRMRPGEGGIRPRTLVVLDDMDVPDGTKADRKKSHRQPEGRSHQRNAGSPHTFQWKKLRGMALAMAA